MGRDRLSWPAITPLDPDHRRVVGHRRDPYTRDEHEHARREARQRPVTRPHGRVDKLAIKNVAGKGYVVVPPAPPPLRSRIGSQADFGLTPISPGQRGSR